VFVDIKVLERPPFVLFYEIVKFISKEKPSFHWDSLFFDALDCSSKQTKIIFIVRLLAIVSHVTGIRLDIYIASPQLLLGHDALSAHALLQALATASMVSAEVMSKAVAFVAAADDGNLYNIGVKTRMYTSSVQALFRGWLVRKDMQLIRGSKHSHDSPRCITSQREDMNIISSAEKKMSLIEEEYRAMLLRNSKLEKDILKAEARLNKQKDKLFRIFQLEAKSRIDVDAHPRQHSYLRPHTAPSASFAHTNPPVSISVDKEFAEVAIDIKGIQARLNKKEKMLKARILASKNKEAELKLKEERITELAEKIRNQNHQLKQKQLQFERLRSLPPTAPETTACSQKLDMKAIRTKLKQRVRFLNNREANLLLMAKELRKREKQLSQRERKLSEPPLSADGCYEELDYTSAKKQQIPLHNRRASSGDNHDDDAAASSHGDENEQCSSMNAIEEGDEEDETTTGEQISGGETTSTDEEAPFSCADELSSDSKDKPSTSPPQQSHYSSNHDFTFEKNNINPVNALGHHVDAQLRCAVNNLRDLL
jgi:hypothetical protein